MQHASRRQRGSSRGRLVAGLVVAIAAGGCAGLRREPVAVGALPVGSVERGRAVYSRLCVACHGELGDGEGRYAEALDGEPRDFTRGVFRYRSTPTGSLPTDADLARTVVLGAPGSAMPAFRDALSAEEVADVVAFVKHFSKRFGHEELDEPVAVPEPAPTSEAAIARGRAVYAKLQCAKCHGERGEGDGWAKADEMKDDLGRVVRARDFTRGIYRAGTTRQDLYRVLVTGLDGTPMPAYEGSATPDELRDLVVYLLSLEKPRGFWHWLTTAPRWYEPDEQRVSR